jgi:hypothetical protein
MIKQPLSRMARCVAAALTLVAVRKLPFRSHRRPAPILVVVERSSARRRDLD